MVIAPTTTKPLTPTSATEPKPEPRRSRWNTVLAFVACQIAAILFVESVLYLAGLGEEEIFKFDSQVGFRHMTNKRITWRTEGFAQSYLNEDGMREPGLTLAKPANTYRVALLGDSMTEGFQVPIDQTFGALAGKAISPIDGKQVQVLNFGTSGYSTAQEFLQLKRQVLKYKPDLVLLCYNGRDIFENWSPPDQVITNVRPMAIHLPGNVLTIDNTPVVRWLRTPRAVFLQQIEWLRENSRIFGLFTAVDLELSQKNLWYRAFINIFTHPKRLVSEIQTAWTAQQNKGPAFQIKFFEDTAKKPAAPSTTKLVSAPPVVQQQQQEQHVFNSAASNDALGASNSVLKNVTKSTAAQPSTYQQLINRTLASLFIEMRSVCNANGARFAVAAMPVRAQLAPLNGTETHFNGITYQDELALVQTICKQNSIALVNVEAEAEQLPLQKRESLFYVVHLAPDGQQFLAKVIAPFLKEQLDSGYRTGK